MHSHGQLWTPLLTYDAPDFETWLEPRDHVKCNEETLQALNSMPVAIML